MVVFVSTLHLDASAVCVRREHLEALLTGTPYMSSELNLETGESSEVVPVSFESVVTETGMLQLWCVARDGRRWKLEFNVREKVAG